MTTSFFDAVYVDEAALDLSMECLTSKYAECQFELILRYCDLAQAKTVSGAHEPVAVHCDAGRAESVPKLLSPSSDSSMNPHLSLTDAAGANSFSDTADGAPSPVMLDDQRYPRQHGSLDVGARAGASDGRRRRTWRT